MNTNLSELFKKIIETDNEPRPDIGYCENCGFKADLSKFDTGEEGDWETGYYKIDFCPNCDDSEVSYDFSPERMKLWEEWNDKQSRKAGTSLS